MGLLKLARSRRIRFAGYLTQKSPKICCSAALQPRMGAAESLEASPPSTPEQRGKERHERVFTSPARSAERRPPLRPEPVLSRASPLKPPPSSAARHASPQRVASQRILQYRLARTDESSTVSCEKQGPYRRELLYESHAAPEYAAAAAASPAARGAATARPVGLVAVASSGLESARSVRVAAVARSGPEPTVELRLTRQQLRHCIALRRMLVAQRMARLLATWRCRSKCSHGN